MWCENATPRQYILLPYSCAIGEYPPSVQSMITWNGRLIGRRMRALGLTTNGLARATGLAYPIVWRIVRGGELVARVDTRVLEAVAIALGVDRPLRLLEYSAARRSS